MTKICTTLLLITLLFPPFTAASISMACSMPEMEDMPMAHPMDHASEEPMDGAHACCTMPESEGVCEIEVVAEVYACCDEVQIARDLSQVRVMPVSRYDASDISLAALAVAADISLDATPTPQIVSSYAFSFLEDPSPPLQSLLCTYII